MRPRTSTWLGIGALAATALVATACGSATTDTMPSYQGQIAFHSDRDGPFEVYIQAADGGDGIRLTTSGDADDVGTERERAALWPRWSPDGRRIVFQSGPPDITTGQIFVMNADGSAQRQLTRGADNVMPAWSPDGESIAFVSGRDDSAGIYTMRADGSQQRLATPRGTLGAFPTWAPDGGRIAFACARKGQPSICAVTVPGGRVTTIVRLPGFSVVGLEWSPDGRKIVFVGGPGDVGDVYVVGSDGKGLRALTTDSGHDGLPAWSPDGRHIVFPSDRDGGTDLYVMNADGTDQTRLVAEAGRDDAPDWGR